MRLSLPLPLHELDGGSTKNVEAVAKRKSTRPIGPSHHLSTLHSIIMFENLCALPVEHDIFVQTVHPQQPLVAVGLANGDVHTYRLPAGASDDDNDDDDDDNDTTLASESGFGTIDRIWRTRRHKGSCRTLVYSVDGASLISAGTDGIVKVADSMTGQVSAKIAIPLDP